MSRAACVVLASLLIAACEGPAERGSPANGRRLIVAAAALPVSSLEALRLEPKGVLLEAIRVDRRLELTLDSRATEITVHAPGACPQSFEFPPRAREGRTQLTPLIELSGPASDVGFDATFEVSVRTGCASARRGSIAWSVEGAPLAELSVLDGGFRVVGRTAPAPERLTSWPAGHVVPVSPAERGTTRLVARWTSPSGDMVTRSIDVSAAPRSRGLPNVGLGERVLLAGSGYRVVTRPDGALAEVMPWGSFGLSSLVPDRAGAWELDAGGRRLRLHADRYDAVPLDCGRTECHAAETHAAQSSPMTAALVELLARSEPDVACAFGCHTTGEHGGTDGGFSHALADLDIDAETLPAWNELPRPLRRLGGVGCLACHGPTAMPEESARWAILRADVCAYCHDAPPRYGHVRAWRSTALARADERLETRAIAECARCHTTWGLLDAVNPSASGSRIPPDDASPMGVACVACHAVHAQTAVQPGLLRRAPVDAVYAGLPESAVERSSTCIRCHSPEAGVGPSAALIWAGQGAQDPLTGAPLLGPAPHAAVPGGCVGCHGSRTSSVSRGVGHDFRATPDRCPACHADRPIDRSLFERARHLLSSADAPAERHPAHARPSVPVTVEDRALALARLVLEDRGAAVHNPRYAELLLDRAALVLARSEKDAR